jgi:hypothetical protein
MDKNQLVSKIPKTSLIANLSCAFSWENDMVLRASPVSQLTLWVE